MIGYRYFYGNTADSAQCADADQILDKLTDLLLRENDISKSLDLLKQQGLKEEDESPGLKGINDFLEEVRSLKQKLQESASAGNELAMEELKRVEKLEHELRRASWGLELEKINDQEIRDLLGEQNYQLWKNLKAIPRLLEITGFFEKLGTDRKSVV